MGELKITPKLEKKYLEYPDNCPFCDSNNITGDHIDTEGDSAYRNIDCSDCGAYWTETFDLVGISDAYKN